MQYLLTIYMNPDIWEKLPEAEREQVMADHDTFQQPIRESGELLAFAALAEPAATRTVRVRGGVPAVTDGPYLEAKEHLAGYYIVECGTPERAAELAAQLPDARYTAIEVRPVVAASDPPR